MAEVNELKTQTMFGRLLWAGSGDNCRSKTMHLAKIGSSHLIISLSTDLFTIRVWNEKGECLFNQPIERLKQAIENFGSNSSLENSNVKIKSRRKTREGAQELDTGM